MTKPFPKHLQTLERAIKYVRRKKREEVLDRFPPWLLQKEMVAKKFKDRGLRFYITDAVLYLMVGLVVRHTFHLADASPVRAALLCVGISMSISTLLFIPLGRARARWLEAHPFAMFDDKKSRREALKTVDDELIRPGVLVSMALNELKRCTDGRLHGWKETSFRESAVEPTYVRIVAEIESAREETVDVSKRYAGIVQEIENQEKEKKH